jgi:hypothetical protein
MHTNMSISMNTYVYTFEHVVHILYIYLIKIKDIQIAHKQTCKNKTHGLSSHQNQTRRHTRLHAYAQARIT